MQLRVVKRIPFHEVNRRVSEIEEKHGGNLEEIPSLFKNGLVGYESFEDYVEWIGMNHALRAYLEGEDFDYYREVILELGRKELSKLTPRRIELLDQLSRFRADSINDLASKIGRDVKNVYNDLKLLQELGFVALVKEGRSLIPQLLVQEVTILLW